MSHTEIRVPDIGDFDAVEIIEVLVTAGDQVEEEQSLLTLESDKATMEVPSSAAGTVVEVKVAVGDKVAQGDLIAVVATGASASTESTVSAGAEAAAQEDASTSPPAPAAAPAAAAAAPPTPAPAPAPAPTPARLPDADLHAEVLVIGAGPGGYSAAFRAADLGKKVVLVERFPRLGGVCLNVGCIPSKALLHAAKVLDEAAAFADHGIAFGEPSIDLDALRSWKDGVVQRLTGGLKTLAKQRKVTVVHGLAKFAGQFHVEVDPTAQDPGDDFPRRISFESCILAAGSRVVELPFLPEDERIVDSTGALELRDIPSRLLIIGGGIIGVEMGTVYHGLGSKVTVVELMDGLLPGADKDIVRPLARRLGKRFEAIHLKTKVSAVEAREDGLVATLEGPDSSSRQETFDRVLVSVGRRPNGDRLGAEAAGLEVTERGFIPSDRQQRTNVPHIFSIGDLKGNPMLAHKSVHEGKIAAEVIAGHKVAFDARVIPSVAYTDPEVAWVGLTEIEAKERGVAYEKGAFPWAASGRSLAIGRDEGVTKVLFDPDSGRVLGAGIVGTAAGDLIAEVALAIEMGCDAEDIALTVHPHPTLSETVAMSAEAFEGTLTDLYLPKRKKKS
ncbi:MAG: dihydrolipoyl dehydrogenase [Acidobacteriota bacterium]